MKIILIRHSQTTVDPTIAPELWTLSDEGIRLAQNLAIRNEITPCQVICTSFQAKAIETALIIAKTKRILLHPLADLNESTSVTNGFIENYEERILQWHKGNHRINDGETKEETTARLLTCIEDIQKRFTGMTHIAVVSHANALACISEHFSNQSSDYFHPAIKMPGFAVLDLETRRLETLWT